MWAAWPWTGVGQVLRGLLTRDLTRLSTAVALFGAMSADVEDTDMLELQLWQQADGVRCACLANGPYTPTRWRF